MMYSVSTWIFGDEKREDVFATVAELGYDALELPGEPDKLSPDVIRRETAAAGLRVESIAGIFPWPTQDRDLSSPSSDARKRAIKYLERTCEFAAAVGASLVVVSPTPVGKTRPEFNEVGESAWQKAEHYAWECATSALREAAGHAERAGVVLAIEPLNRYETFLVNNASSGVRLVECVDSPSVGIHLDTFHMNIEEASASAALRLARKHLVNVHVADSNRCAVGMGHFDFASVVKTLIEIDYRGPITLEPMPAVSDPYATTDRASFRTTLREYLAISIDRLRSIEKSLKPNDL